MDETRVCNVGVGMGEAGKGGVNVENSSLIGATMSLSYKHGLLHS